MNNIKNINFNRAKIAIFTHKETDAIVGISLEKSRYVNNIIHEYKEDPSKISEEEVEACIFLFNEKEAYYETNPIHTHSFKIIELRPELVRVS